jgi:uncharacterized membrane protein (UPF0136 family)
VPKIFFILSESSGRRSKLESIIDSGLVIVVLRGIVLAMTNFDQVLGIYIAALIIGGFIESARLGGKAPLVVNGLWAVPLVLAAWGTFGVSESRAVARFVSGCCLAFFACRWWVSRSFISSGLMALVLLVICGLLAGFAHE